MVMDFSIIEKYPQLYFCLLYCIKNDHIKPTLFPQSSLRAGKYFNFYTEEIIFLPIERESYFKMSVYLLCKYSYDYKNDDGIYLF